MKRHRALLSPLLVLLVVIASQLAGARSSGAAAPSFAAPVALTGGAVLQSSVAWGDYDADGDLDILLTGVDAGPTKLAKVYRNDGGTFTDINAGLVGESGIGCLGRLRLRRRSRHPAHGLERR